VLDAIICAYAGRAIGTRKGHRELGELLGLFFGILGVAIIVCVPKSQEARVREAEARLRAEDEARRRLDAEGRWPNRNPWDAGPGTG